jgi:hypothetical protein
MTAIALALVGIGVLMLDRHPLSRFRPLPLTAGFAFLCAALCALVNQAGW